MDKAAVVIAVVVGVLALVACFYSLAAWVVIAAVNLFIENDLSFTFWQYALIGWALAICNGFINRGRS